MELKAIRVFFPEGANIIIGQAHFIKTVEDLYEAMASTVPQARYGIAFCEASGPCLVRTEGNDPEMIAAARDNALAVGAGHSFVIVMAGAYPINVLNAIKSCPEVASIYCATANPVEVIVADTGEARAMLGVADGYSPKGVEGEKEAAERKALLRKIGYKR